MKNFLKKTINHLCEEPEFPESSGQGSSSPYETDELPYEDLDSVSGGADGGIDAGKSLWLFHDS